MKYDKSILVTGGAGFIGSHTAVSLIEKGFEPIIVDDLRNSYKFIIDRIEEITGKKVVFHQVECHCGQHMMMLSITT